MTDILAILQWAIPSGGVGAAIAWLAHRKVAQAKDASAVHDIYKKMYDDVSAELVKMQTLRESLDEKLNKITQENDELRRAVNRLRITLLEIKRCPHYAGCPVRNELQNTADTGAGGADGDSDGKQHAQGQYRNRNNTEDRNNSGRHCDDGDSDDKPPASPGGSDVQH